MRMATLLFADENAPEWVFSKRKGVKYLNFDFKVFESFSNDTNDTKNIVLIGDSILNNSVYVFEKQSVPELITIGLIKDKTNKTKTLYNFAKDGSIISDCHNQLIKMDKALNTKETTIFVSAGGNNILNSILTVNSNAVAFINNLFAEYLQLISAIKTECPSATIVALNLYYPSNKSFHPLIKQWNQLMSDNSSKSGYKLIKLDEIIVSDEDIVYDVEPSFIGGQKMADVILRY
jgi:lysophospholipase L1-like esterase